MSRTAHFLTALAASALASVTAATAGAASLSAPVGDPPSVTVRYADLDLQTAQGVATLYHRLTMAASQVCPQGDAMNLHLLRLSHDCRQAAIQRAIGVIGSPMLARTAIDHGVRNN